MNLTNLQMNAVVTMYSISMLDTLMTVIGISTGAGEEGNRLFSWITDPGIMFVTMFLANIIVILAIITYMTISNECEIRPAYDYPKFFTYALFVAAGYRLFAGPGMWAMAIMGMI